MLVGALLVGTVADRNGRRRALLGPVAGRGVGDLSRAWGKDRSPGPSPTVPQRPAAKTLNVTTVGSRSDPGETSTYLRGVSSSMSRSGGATEIRTRADTPCR
jgi:hypothetical protein